MDDSAERPWALAEVDHQAVAGLALAMVRWLSEIRQGRHLAHQRHPRPPPSRAARRGGGEGSAARRASARRAATPADRGSLHPPEGRCARSTAWRLTLAGSKTHGVEWQGIGASMSSPLRLALLYIAAAAAPVAGADSSATDYWVRVMPGVLADQARRGFQLCRTGDHLSHPPPALTSSAMTKRRVVPQIEARVQIPFPVLLRRPKGRPLLSEDEHRHAPGGNVTFGDHSYTGGTHGLHHGVAP